MKTFNLYDMFSQDIYFRSLANQLYEMISVNEKVIIDFANITFISRSFADEFYNLFIKDKPKNISIINTNEDIQTMLSIVAKTQHAKKPERIIQSLNAKSIDELQQMLSTIGV